MQDDTFFGGMKLSPTQGCMCVLDSGGDTKIIWDRTSREEVKNAERTFKDLIAKGFSAFLVSGKGEKTDKVTTFDPDYEKLILVPRIAGG